MTSRQVARLEVGVLWAVIIGGSALSAVLLLGVL